MAKLPSRMFLPPRFMLACGTRGPRGSGLERVERIRLDNPESECGECGAWSVRSVRSVRSAEGPRPVGSEVGLAWNGRALERFVILTPRYPAALVDGSSDSP